MSSNKPALSARNIKKSFGNYGAFVVLKDVNFSIQQGERIGLVGPNGAGKTTLLKILAGLVVPEAGTVTVSKGIEHGYIPQEFSEYLNLSALEFIETVISGEAMTIRVRLAPILVRLRLEESILGRKLNQLSGGEKTKIALMRILVAEQNCLLLDEPTNNLDISALQVLEDFVNESKKTFLIISHDRAFLDATVNRIFEIDEFERTLRIYEGNYSAYSALRAAQIERDWKDYADKMQRDKQLEKAFDMKVSHIRSIEKVRKGIRHLNPKLHDKPDDAILRDKEARAGHRAKVMKNRLERFREQSEGVTKPKEFPSLKVRFESDERSGNRVFEAKGIVKKLPEHILGPFDFDIRYGERVLVTGENGTGKTTILKMLLGELAPDAGEIIRGSRLHIGYLPQQESFDPEATVREEFLRHIQVEESLGRKILNRFKLDAGDVRKKIKELSSGERSRLVLAILMARKVNCLILDEPSNHLDIEVLESLEEALEIFPGTIIVVSHDRYFINRVKFTKTYEVKEGRVREV